MVSKPRGTRWLRALFVVPVLVFALGASSRLEVRCVLTGLVMPDCCQDAAPPPARPQPHTSIRERDCCDRSVVATDRVPVAGHDQGPESAPPVLGRLVLSLDDTVVPPSRRAPRSDVGPARSSPPFFLLTHAFLI